jgi:hypothetical protein
MGSDKAKKGLLKANQGAAAKTGPAKTYSVKHVDGQRMSLELQVSVVPQTPAPLPLFSANASYLKQKQPLLQG